jgi:hypothetical protein
MSSKPIISDYLFTPIRNLKLGKLLRRYKIDKNHKEYYFFPKCPEEVLDVEVYQIPNGELHIVDTYTVSPKRFIFLEEKDDTTLDSHTLVMSFNNGFVYVSKSCRFVLR